MRTKACCLLLALLHMATPSSAANSPPVSRWRRAADEVFSFPKNESVAVGKTAEFRCGMPTEMSAKILTFSYTGDKGNFTLQCPSSNIVEIQQHLKGHCITENDMVFAVWDVKYTTNNDNMTKVECSHPNFGGTRPAYLHLFDNSGKFATLVGSTIGGFFAAMILAGAAYFLLKRSETFQKCYRGKQRDGDEDDGVDTMEMD